MGRAKAIRLVVWKETLDMVRDRRTILTALVLPLVAFPILFGITGYLENPTANPSTLLVIDRDQGGAYATTLADNLVRANGLSVTVQSTANATQAVQTGKYDVAFVIPQNFTTSLSAGMQSNLTLLYSPTNARARVGIALVSGVVSALSQQVASSRLSGKGVTNADLYPIGIATNQVGKAENPSLLIAANLFPSFLLYFTFLGAFYFIVDDIAGEKERRSLEALFTLAPSRTTIFLGKYTVAFILSMVTTVLGLIGTLVALDELGLGGASGGVVLPPLFYPEVIAVVAFAALSLCALGFAISTFARNIREAQQYLSPLFFIFFLPLYFTFSLPSTQLSEFASLPILGYTLLIRDMVLGTVTWTEFASAILVNVVFLLILVWVALRLLRSEKVILRS